MVHAVIWPIIVLKHQLGNRAPRSPIGIVVPCVGYLTELQVRSKRPEACLTEECRVEGDTRKADNKGDATEQRLVAADLKGYKRYQHPLCVLINIKPPSLL